MDAKDRALIRFMHRRGIQMLWNPAEDGVENWANRNVVYDCTVHELWDSTSVAQMHEQPTVHRLPEAAALRVRWVYQACCVTPYSTRMCPMEAIARRVPSGRLFFSPPQQMHTYGASSCRGYRWAVRSLSHPYPHPPIG
jgi:hypothetical protein